MTRYLSFVLEDFPDPGSPLIQTSPADQPSRGECHRLTLHRLNTTRFTGYGPIVIEVLPWYRLREGYRWGPLNK